MTFPISLSVVGSTPKSLTIVGGSLLAIIPVVGIGALLLLQAIPLGQFLYPLPLFTALPFLFLSLHLGPLPAFAAIFVPTLLFWAWSFNLFRGASVVPRRSVILFWFLAALTVVYFVASWDYGVKWQGYEHVIAVLVLNVVAIYLLWRFLVQARSAPSFRHSFLFHWTLFAWLAWFAFPLLGEMP
jgi:hypothetical protein